MEEQIVEKMLNGVPLVDFVAFYIWGLIAMLITFGVGVGANAKKKGWSWPAFWLGWKRISINLLLIAAGIVFWPNISSFMFQSETPIELTMWSAFGLGLGLDQFRAWIKSKTATKK